jgi:hypothetical protein
LFGISWQSTVEKLTIGKAAVELFIDRRKKTCQWQVDLLTAWRPSMAVCAKRLRTLFVLRLVAFEWQQRHEASSFDRLGQRVLADRVAAAFATADDFAVTVGLLL